MTGADRAEAMGRRLARTADRLGMPPAGRDLVLRAFRTAMEPRRGRIDDDHHPDYLHPARTALILMDDTGMTDPGTLAVALLLETRDPTLAVPGPEVERLSADLTAALSRIPGPAVPEDRLLEALLALPGELAAVAVAERLDHARHLHLRERREWEEYHRVTREVYAPLAARVDEALAGRIAWWGETFSRRFLGE